MSGGDKDLDAQIAAGQQRLAAVQRDLRASIADIVDVDAGLGANSERARLIRFGRRTDDGQRTSLQVVHEADGLWSFHGPGAGVQLSKTEAITLAEEILARAIAMAWYLVSREPQGTHHGVVVDGDLLTDCGAVFDGRTSVRLQLPPGQRPPDPGQICGACAGEAR